MNTILLALTIIPFVFASEQTSGQTGEQSAAAVPASYDPYDSFMDTSQMVASYQLPSASAGVLLTQPIELELESLMLQVIDEWKTFAASYLQLYDDNDDVNTDELLLLSNDEGIEENPRLCFDPENGDNLVVVTVTSVPSLEVQEEV
jgi:hypothetical protein